MGIHEKIETLVTSNDVVLFMKGDRRRPGCGFSAQVASVLDEALDDYVTVNVLESPEMREGIKMYSDWPTIPQLYIKGKFVGGCDIVTQMAQSGDLQRQLGVEIEEVKTPTITVTGAAAAALREAGALVARLEVDAEFRPGLTIDSAKPNDIEVASNGVTLLLDRMSARRADGVSIDFIPGGSGGFKIENPNESPHVRPISPQELRRRMDAGGAIELFDVRTVEERAIAQIDGARLLDDETSTYIQSLAKDTPLYFFCHHGIRSRSAAEQYLRQGFRTVYNVEGGIDTWSQTVNQSVPRY